MVVEPFSAGYSECKCYCATNYACRGCSGRCHYCNTNFVFRSRNGWRDDQDTQHYVISPRLLPASQEERESLFIMKQDTFLRMPFLRASFPNAEVFKNGFERAKSGSCKF
jgi:hypothetical protein